MDEYKDYYYNAVPSARNIPYGKSVSFLTSSQLLMNMSVL